MKTRITSYQWFAIPLFIFVLFISAASAQIKQPAQYNSIFPNKQQGAIPTWEMLYDNTGPSLAGNSSAGLTYDGNNTVFLLLTIENWQLWKFDLVSEQWTQLPLSNIPGGKVGAIEYDFTDNSLFIYCHGIGQGFRVSTNGGALQQVGSSGCSDEFYSHTNFFNPVTNEINTFGGYGYYTVKNSVLRFNRSAGNWENVAVSGTAPYPRTSFSVTDRTRKFTYIVGGHGNQNGQQGSGFYDLRDLWKLDHNNDTWTQILPVGSISDNHFGAGVALDPVSQTIYSFGGTVLGTSNYNNNFYKFTLGSSTDFELVETNGTKPEARYLSQAFFDSQRNRVVFFGGTNQSTSFFSDVWALNLGFSGNALVSTDSLYIIPGDTVRVPITFQNMNNVGAVSIDVQYDPAVLTWVGAQNWSPNMADALAGIENNVVTIGWDGMTGFSVDSEKVADLTFVYNSGSTAFNFLSARCEITDIDEQPISVTYTNGAVHLDLGTPLTGTLAYRNTAFTPLNNVTVRLLKNNSKVDSSAANTSGIFGWTNIVQGSYALFVVNPSVWGGSNSTDALAIRRYLIGLRTLDTLQILAGDVNNSGTLTSADALLIRRRFAFLDNSFARGNWVFETPSLRKYHRSQTQDILGICVGDVNASFVPGLLKSTPNVQYAAQGEIAIQPGKEMIIPVYVNTEERLGAVTLLFDYDQQNMRILGVTSDMDGMVYNAQDGQLAIAWDALEGITAGEDTPLLYIQAEVLENASGDIRMTVNTEVSELADVEGFVLQGAIVSFPAIGAVIPNEFALEQNFPNPFNPTTTIQYDIPANAHVRVEIFNTLGEVVEVLADAVQAPGRYSVEWNAKNFTTGVYFYRITAESGTKNFMQVKKLMLVK